MLNIAYGISVPSTDVDPNLQGTVMPQGDFGDGDIVHAASNEAAAMRPLGMDDIEAVPHADSEINESRIVGIVNQLLLDALRRGATDIHIENERRQVAVRYKLDGLLYKMKTPLHKDNVDEVINRLKVMATLDISERRSPQDGRVLLRTLRGGRDYDVPFRISILPGPYGEEIVLRVLDKSMAPISLELLGFTSHDLKLYRRLIQNPQGMILVTGPTGSGKTTTLYATLKEINSPYNKILSAEDPIEYNIEGVNQKQISEKFDFADMARAFLRHDPDILLIGEIRDEDTADVACKAAQTGHLILSTVHTNDSVSTISRLNVLGLNHELIGSSLLGVLSQRLVRRICPKCTEAYEPDAEALETFGEFAPTGPFQHGAGCDYCSRTGYRGRIGIFELLIVDDEIQRMISEHAPLDAILEISLAKGMTPLVYDGLRKVEMGYTTLEELNRVVPYRQIAMQLKRKAKYLTDEPKKEATEIVEGGIGAVADIILPPGDATN
ncbi:MAG: GspE/PulE family protein [Deltaproteobacteria bacterium]|nr:GspE/PulE family protein [Deltaproteobacteria bacterium]